jgi:hypothetical protein
VSPRLAKHYLDQENVWETDVARFGIDIWMTTSAIVGGFNLCQARLGVKIHGEKDPAGDLGPMYRQVVGTIFQLMETTDAYWKKVKGSRDIPTFGDYPHEEPLPFEISQDDLIEYFQTGFFNFSGVWQQLIEEQDMDIIKSLAQKGSTNIFLPVQSWVRIVYRYANAFHSTPRQRMKVLNTMIPLYYARVASLVNELKDMDTLQAEVLFQEHAQAFEDMKDYLIQLWK